MIQHFCYNPRSLKGEDVKIKEYRWVDHFLLFNDSELEPERLF